MRMGLFEQLFLRLLALIGALVAILMVFTHVFQQRHLDEVRSDDLEQEARWTALHWGGNAPPEMLARAWRSTHKSVRLSIQDENGHTLADSDSDAPSLERDPVADNFLLLGRAPISLPQGKGTLVLSRDRTPVLTPDLGWKLLLWISGMVVLTALTFYFLVRRLTKTFDRLSEGARRVADGHFGATLPRTDQRELNDLITSFNDMSLRLHSEEVRKRRLLADVSHELRSPMGRLRALGETIQRHPQEATPHLRQLEEEIALMDRLVGDMLDAASFEQGATALTRKTLPLANWIEQAFARMRLRIEQAKIVCTIDMEPTTAQVSIDPERMVQVIGNLVDNAIAATRERPEPRIELRLTITPTSWEMHIDDNGRGIPEDDLPFVFERFFRVERHRGRATGGAGQGLSISKAIVEAHGGRIAIVSTVDVGTRVRLGFPWDASTPAG